MHEQVDGGVDDIAELQDLYRLSAEVVDGEQLRVEEFVISYGLIFSELRDESCVDDVQVTLLVEALVGTHPVYERLDGEDERGLAIATVSAEEEARLGVVVDEPSCGERDVLLGGAVEDEGVASGFDLCHVCREQGLAGLLIGEWEAKTRSGSFSTEYLLFQRRDVYFLIFVDLYHLCFFFVESCTS